jgi:predicted ATPase
MVSGISAFESPITALYQAFSKKEKNKRWIAEQEYKDDQIRIVKELLALYAVYDIIDLDTDEFDAFIAFLNINENFLKTASEMELVLFVKDKYEHFLMLR